ncbi:hypothetical protein ACS0TY_010607 [Phlomoides rotata]
MTVMRSQSILIFFFFIILSHFSVQVLASVCGGDENDSCNDKKKALPLKITAFFSILISSIIGVSSPLLSRSVAAFSPGRSTFVIVKAFAAGIILATGFMHVLPDSFDMLSSSCLNEKPWHQFPFTGFVAMLSAIITLMIDSLATSFYTKKHQEKAVVLPNKEGGAEMEALENGGGGHSHHSHGGTKFEVSTLYRYRIIAVVLESGILVHSVVIGLSLGASNNTCSIKGLIAALCFHQMFEGMGLGGCILQADYNLIKKATMAFFFSVTTPFGIAMGMIISRSYKENSPHALIIVGLLNASSAGLLIYMALVDLLAADFMGAKLQGDMRLQIKSYIAVLLGAGLMSVMALWA